MSKESDNGNLSAFPLNADQPYAAGYNGLTKRELFAAMRMAMLDSKVIYPERRARFAVAESQSDIPRRLKD
jgi:hypothetical protein